MTDPQPNRRTFLGTAGLAIGLAPRSESSVIETTEPTRPKIAVLASTYYYLSHAYHIMGRFLDGFEMHDGTGLFKPPFKVASLFTEQSGPTIDLGHSSATRNNVRISPTIADALTLGTGKPAVDGILLIAEHGEYPINLKLQKLYPRKRFFDEAVKVIEASNRPIPIFVDKHLSYDHREAMAMVETSKRLKIPLMAGSSLPVTWRIPAVEVPLGLTWTDAIVASRGEIEIFGFHALETLQCMVERRDRKGKSQGVVAVTCLEGDAIWEAEAQGLWSKKLLDRALSRNHSTNIGDVRQNTREFAPPGGRPTMLAQPIAFLVEYADGFKASALILNGHIDDTSFAGTFIDANGKRQSVSSLFYLPAPPGASFFNPLCLRICDFLKSGKTPYPVERTLLTGGILDAALTSRLEKSRRILTPQLATIDYDPPADSGYIQSPIASSKPATTQD